MTSARPTQLPTCLAGMQHNNIIMQHAPVDALLMDTICFLLQKTRQTYEFTERFPLRADTFTKRTQAWVQTAHYS